MALGLYTLFEAVLLFVNSLAVLNRERFLRKIGLVSEDNFGAAGSNTLANFIQSIQMVMRVPLIAVNSLVILMKLFIG
ncbi:Immediate early response 3-interacting protein 1 [Trichuris trichiura]|uniref:Immediate early response 3-interacting protein 1 n=1 Tax=Trichuris trichiura TaxID=36087 RepID=A0A077Z3V8_TRITR|nr:Immediate early response 3-interacting protein 1 [Trichuris trichiura]